MVRSLADRTFQLRPPPTPSPSDAPTPAPTLASIPFLYNLDAEPEKWERAVRRRALLAVAFNPVLDILATGNADGVAAIWNFRSGKLMRTAAAHTQPINSITFSPDGSYMATGSDDQTASIFRLNGRRVRSYVFVTLS